MHQGGEQDQGHRVVQRPRLVPAGVLQREVERVVGEQGCNDQSYESSRTNNPVSYREVKGLFVDARFFLR